MAKIVTPPLLMDLRPDEHEASVVLSRGTEWRGGQSYLRASIQAVHCYGCPATSLSKKAAKQGFRCLCGAHELFYVWLKALHVAEGKTNG